MKWKSATISEFNSIAEDTDLTVGQIFLSVIKRLDSMGFDVHKRETLRDISDKDMYIAMEKTYKLEIEEGIDD